MINNTNIYLYNLIHNVQSKSDDFGFFQTHNLVIFVKCFKSAKKRESFWDNHIDFYRWNGLSRVVVEKKYEKKYEQNSFAKVNQIIVRITFFV